MTLYDILGVSRIAPPSEIRAAYRKLSKIHHPDKGGDPAMFASITLARDVLFDEARRAAYDATGKTEDPNLVRKPSHTPMILQLLSDAFLITLAEVKDMAHEDLFALVRVALRMRAKMLEKKIAETQQGRRTDLTACVHLSHNGKGGDVIRAVLSARRAQALKQIREIGVQIGCLHAAVRMSRDYSWKVKPRPKPLPTVREMAMAGFSGSQHREEAERLFLDLVGGRRFSRGVTSQLF